MHILSLDIVSTAQLLLDPCIFPYLVHSIYHRWCTTGSTDRCSGGLPTPHTANCWDHCWSGAVGKKGTQEENPLSECTATER